jgi:exonuclease SbcD
LAHEPEGAVTPTGSYRSRLAGRDDVSIARDFVAHVRGTPTAPEEDRLLAEAFDVVGVRSRAVA